MNLKRFSGGTLGLLAVAALTCGCSSKSDDCKANLSCNPFDGTNAGSGSGNNAGASGIGGQGGLDGTSGQSGTSGHSAGDGGTGGDGGSGGATPSCNGALSPDADTCVISDDYGIFVSPDGNDNKGDGTEAMPFATLTTALSRLSASKRIYVCDGDYTEPATLEIPSGVSIFGGFGCDGGHWTYDSANYKANFTPMSPIGAELKNATGVTLQDLSITAQDATSPGASSFGMTVVGGDVALTRVDIKAGKGAVGSPGVDGVKGADGADASDVVKAQKGQAAICDGSASSTTPGAWDMQSACGVQGGHGGAGSIGVAGETGAVGEPTVNVDPAGKQNGGPGAMTVGLGNPGTVGADGSIGNSGAIGMSAKASGVFSAEGYLNASGGDGTDGFPGQGGGGGGGSKGNGTTCTGASGGAGGMAGCGGTRGIGGKGGGASVAVLSWNSNIRLLQSSLIANTGGAGGRGGKAGTGGLGKQGGGGGDADTNHGIARGGNGGTGGLGGNGGNGAGGTGGPSIGIVYSTIEPVIDATSSLTPGTGGTLGAGGDYGDSMTKAADGAAGLAKDKYQVPQQ